ncbi:MAG: enoyl-CoA hydratase/isomerase family protein [Chloroflexota bacterium]|nr:enoyl-CoA hydratase/isomerase family protein [Chloroflexota bacterium]
MAYETVLYEKKGRIAYITLNRPQMLNAINDTLARDVMAAFQEFDVDEEAWVAIFSGQGRCFCAGADVKQRQMLPREQMLKRGGPGGMRQTDELLGLGRTVNWKPVIAAIHSYAVGGGFAMAMECDLVVAAEDMVFELTELHRGLGGAQHWAKAWFWGGARMANEFAITGKRLSASESLSRGMINRVVPKEQLMAEAEQMAQDILRLPPLAVRCNVRVCRWYMRERVHQAEMYQNALKLYLTEDFEESTRAFVEKRQPVFRAK